MISHSSSLPVGRLREKPFGRNAQICTSSILLSLRWMQWRTYRLLQCVRTGVQAYRRTNLQIGVFSYFAMGVLTNTCV